MFLRHQFEKDGTVLLLLDPMQMEFSTELGEEQGSKNVRLFEMARNYVLSNIPNATPKIVKVVMGPLVVATFVMSGGGQGNTAEAATVSDSVVASTTSYTVQSGDTLTRIANRYGMTVTDLKSLNGLTSDLIFVGQVLKVTTAPVENPIQVSTATYTIKSGDTLSGIAKQYGMTTDQLKTLNGLTSDLIYPGQVLKVTSSTSSLPVAGTPTSPSQAPTQPAPSETTTTYTVKSGDTLSGIAKQYNVTVTQLKQTNQLTSDIIFIGQRLTIPSPVVAPTPAPSPTDSTLTVLERKAALAKDSLNYLGVPYVWGGTTTSGFDCSGFVYFMTSKHGFNLPRTTSGSYYQMGTAVSRANLVPGDMVFYAVNRPGEVSHVGFYIGNNQFISATTSKGIAVYSLDSTYWKQYYLGAKRLF